MPRPYLKGNLAIQPQEEVVVDITKNNLLEQEQAELEQQLVGYGFSQKAAQELTDNWSSDYIWQKIRLVENLLRRNPGAVKNLPGFIRQAIVENYRPAQSGNSSYAQSTKNAQPSNPRYRRIAGPGANFPRQQAYSAPSSPVSSYPASATDFLTSGVVEANPVKPDAIRCALLWERICTALSERFRRPDLALNLRGARLELEPAGRKAKIYLEQPWLNHSLLSAERAVLQLAFSQEVGAGYRLEIGGS